MTSEIPQFAWWSIGAGLGTMLLGVVLIPHVLLRPLRRGTPIDPRRLER